MVPFALNSKRTFLYDSVQCRLNTRRNVGRERGKLDTAAVPRFAGTILRMQAEAAISTPAGAMVQKLSNVGPYENNIYLLWDAASSEGYILDGGFEPELVAAAAEHIAVKGILVTHGHRDHHENVAQLRDLVKAPVGIAEADRDMLSVPADFLIEDRQVFRFGPHGLVALHTPGHTPGSVSFLLHPHLFTGDTLFPGGPGKTATSIGSFPTIIESIRSRLFTLPEETIVYPGHGRNTVLAEEKPQLDSWIARGW